MNNYKYTIVPISDFPRIEESKQVTARGNSLYKVPGNIEVKSMNPVTGEVEWVHPTTFSVHPDVDIYLVQFNDGDFTFMGKNHSLVVYRDDGLEEVDTDKALGRFSPTTAIEDEITELTSVIVNSKMGSTGVKGTQGKGYIDKSFELKLDYKTGLFIGMVIGDGWVDSMDILYLAGSTKEKLLNRKLFGELCNSSSLPYENGVKEVDRVSKNIVGNYTSRGKTKVTCSWFNRWLKEQIGSGAFNKKIPNFSLNASKEHLMGILDGLISTDGAVCIDANNKVYIAVSSSSIELINGMKQLSKRLGLKYGIYAGKSKISGKFNYNFRFQNPSFKKFVEETKFNISHPLKQENLEKAMTLIVGNARDYTGEIPAPSQKLQEDILNKLKNFTAKESGLSISILKRAFRDGEADKETVLRINDIVGENLEYKSEWASYLTRVLDNKITWLKVRKVTEVKNYIAHDLELPNYGNFFTTSCLQKNSDGDQINIHIPATEEARKEVLEKMMPSKNLLSTKAFKPVLIPSNESALGLYSLSTENHHNAPKKFKTEAEVITAYEKGDLTPGDNVELENA